MTAPRQDTGRPGAAQPPRDGADLRPLRFGISRLRRGPLLRLLAWSVPEMLPAAVIGVAVARAVDEGFLAGKPVTGLAWLAVVLAAALPGAVGARQVLRCLGDLVEPVRDELVRRVVTGALRHGVAGHADDGAVARLTRQVEIVRDTYAGLIIASRSFLVTLLGTAAGVAALAPILLVFIGPPLVLGFAAFAATLGLAADRYRRSVHADEELAVVAGAVLQGARDVVASGGEQPVLEMAARSVARQAEAERALAATAMLRTACFAIAGWVPLVAILAAGPWLVRRGLTAGQIMGGLTYVLFGLQPAVGKVMTGLGGSGLKFVVTLRRILEVTAPVAQRPLPGPGDGELRLREVTFAYGPHSEPVLRDLDLTIAAGDHLAILGPSGSGKSTLAAILCGLLPPSDGRVHLGGRSVLVPQEAYVFTGTLRENLCYLRPEATDEQIGQAVAAVGAQNLVARLGGLAAPVPLTRLSAGERQLISLVRAYLSPAPIAVLDEASCHLDPVAERQAEEAFAAQGRTLIIIAHRVSSALRAPRVLIVDGADTMVGDHDTLAMLSPLYQALLGHWHGSQPAGLLGDPDGFYPGTGTGLREDTGEMVTDGAMTKKQLYGDVTGG